MNLDTGSFQWKGKQKDCLNVLYERKDLFAVLPTGYGKSLIYQSAPFLCAARDGEDITNTNKIVVVITPLNSIMLDQCMKLNERGIKSCALDYSGKSAWCVESDNEDEPSECEGSVVCPIPLHTIPGNVNILYCHPEALIRSTEGRTLLRRVRKMVCAVAIDEAHMIMEW